MVHEARQGVSVHELRASAAVVAVLTQFAAVFLGGSPTAVAQTTRPLRARSAVIRAQAIEVSHQDGVDDTETLQRAIDTAADGGASVHVRSGVYHLKIRDGIRALAPRRNVRLIGDGPEQTVLRLDPGQGGYEGIFFQEPDRAQDVSGFSLEDLAIDQDTTGNPISDAAILSRKPRFILAVFNGSDIRVENCRFTDVAGVNTLVFNGLHVSNIRISNNRFEKVGNVLDVHYDHSTIYTHAESVYITGNSFSGRVSRGGAFGATTAIETHGNQQIVTNNMITGYIQGMNITGVAESSEGVVVADNVISDAVIGIHLWSYRYGSNKMHPGLTKTSVSGNAITISRDPWAKVVGRGSLAAAGILVNPDSDAPFEQLRIDGNTIGFNASVTSTRSDSQSGGIEMWLTRPDVVSRSIEVTNNRISGTYGPGIRLAMSAETVSITNNLIVNPGRSTAEIPDPFRSGVIISHVQHGLSITGNQLVDDQVPGTMRFGIYDSTSPESHELRAVDNQLRSRTAGVLAFQNGTATGAFFLSFRTDIPFLPAHAVAAGSMITDSTTGMVRVEVDVPSGTRRRTHAYGSRAPKSGTWAVGDVVYNTRPFPGGSLGWICVVAGSPGVFRPLPRLGP